MGSIDVNENNRIFSHVMGTLYTMLEKEEFCDLVFVLKDNCTFSAHQLVMAAWSSPLKCLLQVQTAFNKSVYVAFNKPEIFHKFIIFLYTGDFPQQPTDIPSILMLAATFQIHLLTDLCKEHLKANMTVDNVISMYHLSISFHLPDLAKYCVEFLCKHLREISQKQELRDLTAAQMNYFLGSEHMSVLSMEDRLSLIISWLASDVPQRERHLVMLLKHIDWSSMETDFLKEIVQTEKLFTLHPSSLFLLLQTLHSSSFCLGPYESHFGTLQKRYSYLFKDVVSCSVPLGSYKPKSFQPLPFSLVPLSTEKHFFPQVIFPIEIENIKKEHLQIINCANNDTTDDKTDSLISQNIVTSPKNLTTYNLSENKSSCSTTAPDVRKSASCTIYMSKLKDENNTSYAAKTTESGMKINCCMKINCSKSHRSITRQDRINIRPRKKDPNEDSNFQSRKIRQTRPSKLTALQNSRKTKSDTRNKIIKRNSKQETIRKPDSQFEIQKCADCEFIAYSLIKLQKHHKQVHESNCLFCCDLCTFNSKRSNEYYEHMKQHHFPGPPFHCDGEGCEYSTGKIQEMISHRRQHRDQRPFVCDICLTAFRRKNNLYQHLKIHSDEKKFSCTDCGRHFRFKNTLDQHMGTHSDLRPYLCDLCGFSTKYQSHLISHKKIHTGDVHQCSFPSCTYFTPKKSRLKAHMQSHLGIRGHVCSTCGKAFVEKSHLLRHERIHLSERAHVCQECNYSSTRADKLKEHVRKHHCDEASRVKFSVSKMFDTLKKIKKVNLSNANRQSKDGSEALLLRPNSLIEVIQSDVATVGETGSNVG